MRRLLISIIAPLLMAPRLSAQPEFILRQSLSEQFTVYGPQASPIRHFQSSRVPLDSSLAAVSCQRIKQALLGQLENKMPLPIHFKAPDEGKIFVVLHAKNNLPVVITPVPAPDSLNYRIDLPNEIEATRFVDAITETLLLERVNRHSRNHFTQIPLWLTQGLSSLVQQIAPETLVLEPHQPLVRIKTKLNPVTEARSSTNFLALTFDELSWPEVLPPEKAAHYRRNAELLVAELTRLKNGRAKLLRMINALAGHAKWQVPFLEAFEFKRFVDAEKWWALTTVDLSGNGGAAGGLSLPQSIESLDAALEVPVDVFHDFGSLPNRNNFTLQQVISSWETPRQNPALQRVVSQLRRLRFRVHPELVPLLDDYRAALENYLQNIDQNALLRRALFRGSLDGVRQSTRQTLDTLDQRRADFRNRPQPKPSTREEAMQSALEIAAQRAAQKSRQ